MMHMRLVVFIIFIFPKLILSSSIDSVFNYANSLYKEGRYKEAFYFYDSLIKEGITSGELFYNAGNASFKIDKIGYSRYYYENALYYMPFDKEIIHNLNFLLNRVQGDFGFGFPSATQRMENYLRFSNWKFVMLLLSFIFLIIFIVSSIKFLKSKKLHHLVKSIFFVFLSFISVFVFTVLNDSPKIQSAILTEGTTVKSEPISSSTDIFTLYEGAKVSLLESEGGYVKIKLPDGKTGWISKDILLYLYF